jgi:hypothetical protein
LRMNFLVGVIPASRLAVMTAEVWNKCSANILRMQHDLKDVISECHLQTCCVSRCIVVDGMELGERCYWYYDDSFLLYSILMME